MKLEREVEITYNLKLTEEQAVWLKGIMQNPLHDVTPETENEIDRKMRKAFFNAFVGASRMDD